MPRAPIWSRHDPARMRPAAFRETARAHQRLAQKVLDLRVAAPDIVGGPPREGVVHGWIETKQHASALTSRLGSHQSNHRQSEPDVQDGLCRLVTTEKDRQ
jgi:hypothetical protein